MTPDGKTLRAFDAYVSNHAARDGSCPFPPLAPQMYEQDWEGGTLARVMRTPRRPARSGAIRLTLAMIAALAALWAFAAMADATLAAALTPCPTPAC